MRVMTVQSTPGVGVGPVGEGVAPGAVGLGVAPGASVARGVEPGRRVGVTVVPPIVVGAGEAPGWALAPGGDASAVGASLPGAPPTIVAVGASVAPATTWDGFADVSRSTAAPTNRTIEAAVRTTGYVPIGRRAGGA